VDNGDILSINSNNPEGDVIRKFYESQIKPKTEEEKRQEEEKEADRLKKLQISQA
jgi:predicted adenine nucleotide alpha hydrolase (AANH) superfamily ATPase